MCSIDLISTVHIVNFLFRRYKFTVSVCSLTKKLSFVHFQIQSPWSECNSQAAFCIGQYNRTRSCILSETERFNWTKVQRDKRLLFGSGHVCGTPVTYYSWNGLNHRNVSSFESTHCHDKLCSKMIYFL